MNTLRKVLLGAGIGIFAALVGVGIFGAHGLIRLHQLRAERTTMENEKAGLERDNQSMSERIEALKTDLKYLEQQARKKLGMIKPDEVIIKLPEDQGGQGTPDKNPDPQKTDQEHKN
jgi:cell division protein FtsB